MGSMSASDAAPLPRLGEVFFDVRGNSRSMRLSWYADTGVAVFSIWQGGTCTGTFRLPIDDLARMVEALRRGPQGPRSRRDTSRGQVSAEQPYGRDPGSGRGAGGLAGPGDGPDPGPSTVAMHLPPAADQRIPASRGDSDYHAEPGGYPGEPAGYPGEPAGYPGEQGGYPGEPAGYPAEPPQRGYRDGPSAGDYSGTASGYREEPSGGDYSGGYPDEPGTGDYRSIPTSGYRDDPLSGDYRGAAAGYRDDPSDYPGEPAGSAYPGEPPLHGYRGDPSAGDYRGGPAGEYGDDAADGYSDDSGDYSAEPLHTYPSEPPFRDYGHEPVIGDYPGESPEHDLAPPRGPGGYEQPGREWEDTDAGPPGGYGEEPSPESFPYGRPPSNRRPRERGRYPGRH